MLKKLNLGCGNDYKEGYINVDYYSKKQDIKHDLDKFPYPFKDNSADEIIMIHVFEHLQDPLRVLSELHRICKKNAKITIKVPHFTSPNAFTDLTHKNFFTSRSFDYYDSSTKLGKNLGFEVGGLSFKIKKKRVNFVKGVLFYDYLVEPLVNIAPIFMVVYELTFLRSLFPASEVEVVLMKT